ncbi:MAG TPA: hypothetical protein VKQ08_11515 [Cyclobacteriaceae bacterium]|nr:hypothetical protein [Cyclobacteriaceae bacterium]
MKKLLVTICLLLLTFAVTLGQSRDKKIKTKKLTKSEAANLTPDQRFVHENDRKSKKGKRNMSLAQKVRIEKRQARSAKRTHN